MEFDRDKRDKTLQERGLDFARAGEVFASVNDILDAFKSTGKGWQSGMNTALRDWLKKGAYFIISRGNRTFMVATLTAYLEVESTSVKRIFQRLKRFGLVSTFSDRSHRKSIS
jgi:hypothetical protein